MAVVYDNDGTEKVECPSSPRRVANTTTIHHITLSKASHLYSTRLDRILRRAKQDARIFLAIDLCGKQVSASWCLNNVAPFIGGGAPSRPPEGDGATLDRPASFISD
jgi:hypothetical protein